MLEEFQSADANSDGRLSFSEANAALGAFSRQQFSDLDTNGDNLLSESELRAILGEEVETPGCALTTRTVQKHLGDLFLFGLAMTNLAAITVSQRQN